MYRHKFWAAIILFIWLLATVFGCGETGGITEPPAGREQPEIPTNEEPERPGAAQPPAAEPAGDDAGKPLTEQELSEYRPNELGQAMILMYHGIGPEEAEWTRTPQNFRRDLEELYNRGYRLVSLIDYVRGEFDLPAGTSPVILTFDDGLRGQFNYLETEDGPVLDPDSAVGILEDFYRRHPDFGRAATFYVYYPLPFRQRDYIEQKFEFLRDNGYEIGNHSYDHGNLAQLSRAETLKELALNARTTAEYLPGYAVRSLALPYGARPQDQTLLEGGAFEGFTYRNEAVLNVGSNPAPSPFDNAFNPLSLPRVRASELKVDNVGMYNFLAYFDKHPERRYVSDGKPAILTAPQADQEKLKQEALNGKEAYFYDPAE